jgi:hypothetical protein
VYRGDTITFGNNTWRVLDPQAGRTLVITEEILELRWYHNKFIDITWADCAVRNYLNTTFYNTFNPAEQSRIIPVTNCNPDNPWFTTNGGADTVDRIFLLSLEEVCGYFGNSADKLRNRGKQRWSIDDENNSLRQSKYNGEFHWWRLRSPGYYARTSASVNSNGYVYVRGNGVYGSPRDGGGVRPALWITIT